MSYGGNTACVEIRYGDQAPLIIDAGTGIRRLGTNLAQGATSQPVYAHILFSHFHWDHIQGLPFFQPLYQPESVIQLYSSRDPAELQRILENQMVAPYFPVLMPAVQARYVFQKVESEGMPWGDLCVRPFALRHPGGATGYRIQSPTGCVVYASDHEHGDAEHDEILRKFASDADILIYDGQYTPEEYGARRGWGHSTWEAGTRTANQAGVKRLLLFHHDPSHEDSAIEEIVVRAGAEFEQTFAAREGAVFSV